MEYSQTTAINLDFALILEFYCKKILPLYFLSLCLVWSPLLKHKTVITAENPVFLSYYPLGSNSVFLFLNSTQCSV